MKNFVCIRCPLGCALTAEEKNGEIVVTGNSCPRGREYAVSEMTDPVRTFSVSVRVRGTVWGPRRRLQKKMAAFTKISRCFHCKKTDNLL